MSPSGLRLNPKRDASATDGRAADSARHASRYDGILQGIGGGAALGWAADRADPAARVPVALVVDGEVVADGVADIARPDLAGSDLGDGAHGFLIALPDLLQAPGRRSILVLVGLERVPIPVARSFWQEPAADGSWSDVVFEPTDAASGLVPPPPARPQATAIVEADGWLFSEEEQDPVHLDDVELERAVALLADNAQRCAELGIAYIPALVPYKHDVLSGHDGDARGATGRALRAKLRDVDGVELLDLRGVLRDAARHGACYHRTDFDWNDRGAFFAARALLKEAHKRVPALRPPALADLHLRQLTEYRGTLADLPKVQATAGELIPCELEIEAESGVTIDAGRLRALRMPVERHLAEAGDVHLRVYATSAQEEQARLVVLGDAAALALVPWLAERASRTTFFWTRSLPLDQLELELPPVALHLVRESDLLSGAPAERDPGERCA
jgi:hypothetical protein